MVSYIFFATIGGWLGYFLGGCDGLLYALIAFAVIDYITGVMCAIADKTLSSEVGFKGICRKVLVFLLVGIANVLDVQVIGTGSVLRTAVIFSIFLMKVCAFWKTQHILDFQFRRKSKRF